MINTNKQEENTNVRIPSDELANSSASTASSSTDISAKIEQVYKDLNELGKSTFQRHIDYQRKYGSRIFNAIYGAAERGQLQHLRHAIDDIGQLYLDDVEFREKYRSLDKLFDSN